MRHERPSHRPARRDLHHRGLDLEEVPVLEKLPQDADHRGPGLEHAPAVGIHDQIDVALPISQFRVAQPVILLGQWPQATWSASRTALTRTLSSPVRGPEQHPSAPTISPISHFLNPVL